MSWKEHCFTRVTACHPSVVTSCWIKLEVIDSEWLSAEKEEESVCSAACSIGHLLVLLNSGCRCFSSVWFLFMTLLFVKICRGKGIYPLIHQDFSQAWNFQRGLWAGKHSSNSLILSAFFPRGALCIWHHYSCRFQYPGEPERICAAVPTEEPGGTCLTNVCLCLPWWELIYPSFLPFKLVSLKLPRSWGKGGFLWEPDKT